MGQSSTIEWTEATWNPTRGCSRISPGCEHCYAERMAHRLSGPGKAYEHLTQRGRQGPRWTGLIRTAEDAIELPLRWKKPRLVFVNSMSDLFHERLDEADIRRIFKVMEKAHWHTFQLLTKRSERLRSLSGRLPWPKNVWMGVSVESAEYLHRIADLAQTPAATKFLSIEPLLGPLQQIPLGRVDWVIVGGESGPGARPMDPEWVRQIRDQCEQASVRFFFKQWGGVRKKTTGRILDGRTWDDMPPRPVR